jgi:hypothetical protein
MPTAARFASDELAGRARRHRRGSKHSLPSFRALRALEPTTASRDLGGLVQTAPLRRGLVPNRHGPSSGGSACARAPLLRSARRIWSAPGVPRTEGNRGARTEPIRSLTEVSYGHTRTSSRNADGHCARSCGRCRKSVDDSSDALPTPCAMNGPRVQARGLPSWNEDEFYAGEACFVLLAGTNATSRPRAPENRDVWREPIR